MRAHTKGAFAQSPVYTAFQFISTEPKPQNSSGDEEWLIFIAGILRGRLGFTGRAQEGTTADEEFQSAAEGWGRWGDVKTFAEFIICTKASWVLRLQELLNKVKKIINNVSEANKDES